LKPELKAIVISTGTNLNRKEKTSPRPAARKAENTRPASLYNRSVQAGSPHIGKQQSPSTNFLATDLLAGRLPSIQSDATNGRHQDEKSGQSAKDSSPRRAIIFFIVYSVLCENFLTCIHTMCIHNA